MIEESHGVDFIQWARSQDFCERHTKSKTLEDLSCPAIKEGGRMEGFKWKGWLGVHCCCPDFWKDCPVVGDVRGEEKELADFGDFMGSLCDGLNAGLGLGG